MDRKYQEWIDTHYPTADDCQYECAVATTAMQIEFPELIRVRGWYSGIFDDPHWWLKTENGEIIDPTAKQFTFSGVYVEYDESQPEPTGKCPNCGNYCYDNNYLCSERCSTEYVAYVNSFR